MTKVFVAFSSCAMMILSEQPNRVIALREELNQFKSCRQGPTSPEDVGHTRTTRATVAHGQA